MALPTPDNLKTMDYAHRAQPFVDVAGKDAVDLETMDWAFQAQPFVRNPVAAPPAGIVWPIFADEIHSALFGGQVVR